LCKYSWSDLQSQNHCKNFFGNYPKNLNQSPKILLKKVPRI